MTRNRATAAKEAAADEAVANEVRGELALDLEGTRFVLRPSRQAIYEFEAKTGKGLIELARGAAQGTLTMAETAQIATACIRAHGAATGDTGSAHAMAETVADLIMEAEGGMLAATRTISTLLIMASSGGYTPSGEAKAATTTR